MEKQVYWPVHSPPSSTFSASCRAQSPPPARCSATVCWVMPSASPSFTWLRGSRARSDAAKTCAWRGVQFREISSARAKIARISGASGGGASQAMAKRCACGRLSSPRPESSKAGPEAQVETRLPRSASPSRCRWKSGCRRSARARRAGPGRTGRRATRAPARDRCTASRRREMPRTAAPPREARRRAAGRSPAYSVNARSRRRRREPCHRTPTQLAHRLARSAARAWRSRRGRR